MQNVDEALAAIQELSGLPGIRFDGDGQVELIFDGDTRVALAKIDDTSFELYTELDHLGGDLSRDVLIRLLTANYLGEATGAGRLTLDPRDKVVCYGRRVDVLPLDAPRLEAVVIDFLRYTGFLRSKEAVALIRGASSTEQSELRFDEMMIRI